MDTMRTTGGRGGRRGVVAAGRAREGGGTGAAKANMPLERRCDWGRGPERVLIAAQGGETVRVGAGCG